MTTLAEWQNFYVIVGSSAGALIGLQFVVMALIANRPRSPELAQAGAAFSTPTIVHFATVLFLAAAMCAPCRAIFPVALVWGAAGLAGVVYSVLVTRRLRRQAAYEPESEDWVFYAALPIAAYAALGASALLSLGQPGMSLFFAAGASLLLLAIGIHNAWDNVTYHVFVSRPEQSAR